MTDNITFALNTIASIGTIAFGIGLLIVIALLIEKRLAGRKGASRRAAPKAQTIDLMEALKDSLTQRKTSTGAYPEEPAEGPQVYPKRRSSGAAR